MLRFVFGTLWTCLLTVFVFPILFCLVAGVAIFLTIEAPAENQAGVDAICSRLAPPMFFGTLIAAIGLSACGVLPGTRRRPAGTAGRDLSAGSDNPGDFDFPPARPIIAVPVGFSEDLPPEIEALGPPLAVHGPGWLGSITLIQRLVVLVLGVALLVGPVAITNALDVDVDAYLSNSAKIAVVFSMLGSFVTCLVIAVSPRSPYAYQVHDEALVVGDGKSMRIIPWDQIEALVPEVPLFKDLTLVTRDGQEVPIESVRGYHDLVGTLFVRLREYLLPLMIRRADAGRMVEFGPLAVSSDALRYKGETTSWDEVTRLLILCGTGIYQLMVYRRSGLGLWAFCRLNLHTLPNRQLLLELLKHVTPSRLLVPTQSGW